MAIKIEMLRCFATVAHSGKLSDAADKLGRTPSAVSMMLKQFEEHLGASLFESERKSRLTALGKFVLGEAVGGLERFDRTVTAIESFARSEAGLVRIAAVPSVAEAILPHVVQRFLSDHPGVWVDIRDMDSTAVLRELENERVDLGLATGVGADTGIDREALFTDAFGIVCRADHPLAAAGAPLHWDALGPWPFIANGLCAQIGGSAFQAIFDGAQLMVHNTTSLLAMVRAGVGVTVLPRLTVDGPEQELTFVRVTDPAARRRIDILRRAHASPSPAVSSFENAVRKTVQDVTSTW